MKIKNLPRQVRLAVRRQQDEQQELLQETPWEKRQRESAEALEEALKHYDEIDW